MSKHAPCSSFTFRSEQRPAAHRSPDAVFLQRKAEILAGVLDGAEPNSSTSSSHIPKQRHESEVHVQLLVAVEESQPGIIRHKIHFHLLISPNHHHIFLYA